jgi:hypothetical protein
MSFFHQLPLEGYNLRNLKKKNPNQKLASIPCEKKFKDVTINTMMAITT